MFGCHKLGATIKISIYMILVLVHRHDTSDGHDPTVLECLEISNVTRCRSLVLSTNCNFLLVCMKGGDGIPFIRRLEASAPEL